MLRFVVLAVFVAAAAASDFKPLSAIVRITSDKVPSNVQGNITFRQINPNEVQVEGTIIGMSPGLYGFHVHEKGDLTNGCLSAGAHFNPYQKTHGAPDAGVRHVGDLGNVEFGSDLIARINFVDRQLSLQGERSILGRAVVLHSGKDDLGLTNHPDSLTTGNAGGRAACGVIGILDPVAWNSATSRAVSVMAIVSSAVLALAFAY